jgi:hypothetical protein
LPSIEVVNPLTDVIIGGNISFKEAAFQQQDGADISWRDYRPLKLASPQKAAAD